MTAARAELTDPFTLKINQPLTQADYPFLHKQNWILP
jgi:hypothetical protein